MATKIILILSGFLYTGIAGAHGQHPHSETFLSHLVQSLPGTDTLIAVLAAGLFALAVKKVFSH